MTDIVERLKDAAREIEIDGTPSQVGLTATEAREAAAEIERLRSALEPFAVHANHYDHRLPGSTIGGSVSNGLPASRLTVAHLRAARAAQMDGATNG